MAHDYVTLISIAVVLISFNADFSFAFTSQINPRTNPCKSSINCGRTIRKGFLNSSRINPSTAEDPNQQNTTPKREKKRYLPRKIARIYTDYASRLWRETSPEARRIIANNRVANTLRQVKHLIEGEKNLEHSDIPLQDRTELVDACEHVLKSMEDARARERAARMVSTAVALPELEVPTLNLNGDHSSTNGVAARSSGERTTASSKDSAALSKPQRSRRSISFGALMGLLVACWVFSGNYIFTGLFTLMTILGQLEYYRMVINTGVYPARRISILGACAMFMSALFTPDLHQICLPMSGLWAMVWFLTMKRTVTTIPEIATTFTGMFYLGYVPSFWVRTRMIGMGREPTRLAPLTRPLLQFLEKRGKVLPSFIPNSIVLPITTGAVFIFWTWLCLAFSDVGAYFVGRKFGKTKLGVVAPAAGATSPNKSVEGVIGGCTASAILAVFGAWVQRWPLPIVTGALHGVVLGLLGLLGDLTASMLKRDAGLKDFGDLLPEHGGIMDRVDSFIWAAPYSWLVCGYVLPALKQWLQ